MNRTSSAVVFALLLCTGACRKDTPKAEAVVASADASIAASVDASSAILDVMGPLMDPLADSTGSHRTVYQATPDDDNTLYDPQYVVVGDPFVVAGKLAGDCAPEGEWAPPALATFLGDELIAPKFPTPLRYYRAHYRAAAKGKGSVKLACTRGGAGHVVATLDLTVLEPADVMPFVSIAALSYARELAPALENGRIGALACFTQEVTRDPKVRGQATMRAWIEKDGTTSIPLDREDYAGTFRGLSPAAIVCVRKAMSSAMAAQKHVDAASTKDPHDSYKEHGEVVDIELRFAMAPKAVDAKACDRYRARFAACANLTDEERFSTPHDAIVARTKVVKTEEGRTALGFACAEAMQSLDAECHSP